MKTKMMSDEIASEGRKQLKQMYKYTFLHNSRRDFEAIAGKTIPTFYNDSGSGAASELKVMIARIIKEQKEREQDFYRTMREVGFDINNIDEFNEFYTGNVYIGDNRKWLDDALYNGIKNALNNKDIGWNETDGINKQELEKSLGEIFSQMPEGMEWNGDITQNFAKRMQKYYDNHKKEMEGKINTYTSKFVKGVKAGFMDDVLVFDFIDNLRAAFKGKGGIKVMDMGIRSNEAKKQRKEDIRISFGSKYGSKTFSIQAKNYKNFENITVNSEAKLDYFLKKIGNDKAFKTGGFSEKIKRQANSFLSNEFKYYLVNEAADMNLNGNKIINSTETGSQVLKFIKGFLPLYMGAGIVQQKDANVDFYLVSGKLVESSQILEDNFGSINGKVNNIASNTTVRLYSNYGIDNEGWLTTMKAEKAKMSTSDGYYDSQFLEIGGNYGKLFYDKIKIGSIHLNLSGLIK